MNISPGTGGTVGGFPTLSAQEVEMTAAAQAMRASLLIVPETVSVALPDVNRHTTWKYNATASNPRLASPLIHLRMAASGKDAENPHWEHHYRRLISFLPTQVREELELPNEERQLSPAMEALDNDLKMTASLFAWSEMLTSEADIDAMAPIDAAAVAYSQLPLWADRHMQEIGTEVFTRSRALLQQIGREHPCYEELSEKINEAEQLLAEG